MLECLVDQTLPLQEVKVTAEHKGGVSYTIDELSQAVKLQQVVHADSPIIPLPIASGYLCHSDISQSLRSCFFVLYFSGLVAAWHTQRRNLTS